MGVDPLELPELAGAGEPAGKGDVRQVAALRASLEDAARAANDLRQLQALSDVLRAGLFAIHVLAGAGRIDGGRAVPVRTGGDQDRVDVTAVEQLAKVAIHRAVCVAVVLVDFFLDGDAAFFFNVADGDELNVLLLQEAAEVISSPVADADTAHHDSLAGSDCAVPAQGRTRNDRRCEGSGGAGRKRAFQEPSTIELRHVFRHRMCPDGVDGGAPDGAKVCHGQRASIIPRHSSFYSPRFLIVGRSYELQGSLSGRSLETPHRGVLEFRIPVRQRNQSAKPFATACYALRDRHSIPGSTESFSETSGVRVTHSTAAGMGSDDERSDSTDP